MSDITIKLTEATAAQLRYFAEVVLGIPLGPNQTIKAETILSKIVAAGYTKDEIAVPKTVGQAAPVASTPQSNGVATGPEPEPMRTIIIEKNDAADGAQPVWVSVNGRGMFIERGKPQTVKQRFVEVLANAVRTVYEQGRDMHDPIVARDVPAYPFRIIA